MGSLPLVLRLERAKADLKEQMRVMQQAYDLPEFLIVLVTESVMLEQRARIMEAVSGQIDVVELGNDKEKISGSDN